MGDPAAKVGVRRGSAVLVGKVVEGLLWAGPAALVRC